MTTHNSVCLDTSRYGVLSALLLPERRIVQSGDASEEACGAPPPTKMIVVLDDKDHALKQVLFELPEEVDRNELVIRHFDTVESFRRADIGRPFIVFLDFFLSKDRVFGSDVIPELSCEHLVCFSSKREMSDHMRKLAGQRDRGRIGHVYSVRKLKEVIENAELGEVLRTIFAE